MKQSVILRWDIDRLTVSKYLNLLARVSVLFKQKSHQSKIFIVRLDTIQFQKMTAHALVTTLADQVFNDLYFDILVGVYYWAVFF